MNNRIKALCKCALFSAIICSCSIITIPTGPIPVNLALFAIILTALTLPPKESLISVAVFIAIGAVGLPVFAGMQGGFGVIAGPTGGFILGYLPCVLCSSLFTSKSKRRAAVITGTVTGCIICYLCGCLWYSLSTGTTLANTFLICALPFIPADTAKAATAIIISKKIKGLI
jgi:biotin transport system substrate-specific component